MNNPFCRFNTAQIIIASIVALCTLFPQGAFSQEEKLPRLVIEDLDGEPIWFFEYFESTNELLTSNRHGVAVWSMDNGELISRYQVSCGESASLSKSGRYMAVGCGNNRMFVYDRDRDEIVFEHSIPPIPAPSSVFGWFSKQENILLITYYSSVIEVWDIEKNVLLFEERQSDRSFSRVQFYESRNWFLTDSGVVYSIMMEGPLFFVDTNNVHLVSLVNQDRHLVGRRQVWEPDGNSQIVRFDAMTGEMLEEYNPIFIDPNNLVRFSPDGNYLIEGTYQSSLSDVEPGPVEIVGIADRNPVRTITNAARESFLVRDMKFFHGGRTLAISSGPRLYIYDASDLITDVPASELHED